MPSIPGEESAWESYSPAPPLGFIGFCVRQGSIEIVGRGEDAVLLYCQRDMYKTDAGFGGPAWARKATVVAQFQPKKS